MNNMLIAGFLAGICLPVLGSFLVMRRYSLIADSLTHVSLAGIGLGLVSGIMPVYGAIPVAVLGALCIEYLRGRKKLSGETSLAILMSAGLALSVVLTKLSNKPDTDLESYLFGNIEKVGRTDVIALAVVAAVAVSVLTIKKQDYLHIAFDEDSAKISGLKVSFWNYLLVSMTALAVVVSLKIVGGLLISSMIVLPVVSASKFAKSFERTLILAVIIAVVSAILGILIALNLSLPAGATIVLVGVFILILSLLKH